MVLESLERREVFAGVVFDSLTALGNGIDSTQTRSIDADQVGNTYVTGRFAGVVDFDPSTVRADNSDILTARGIGDIYVAKYAQSGSLVWVVQFGGDNMTSLNGDVGDFVKVDMDGNVFVGGGFANSISFGSQTYLANDTADTFVARLNSNGVVQWALPMGTVASDSLVGLDVDTAGNLIAATQSYSGSLSIKKWGVTGSEIWSKSVATHGLIGGDLVVDNTGNVYIASAFYGTVDFDPSSKVKNVSSGTDSSVGAAFVLSLNSNGAFRWVSPFLGQRNPDGSIGKASAGSLAMDSVGNVIVGGGRTGRVDYQASSGTYVLPGERGATLVSLNPTTGYLNWAKSIDSFYPASVADLDVDSAGNIYATGVFTGTADFDPSSGVTAKTSVGGNDIFYMKLSAAGSMQWVETLGGVGDEYGVGIAVDGQGGVNLVGNLNPNTTVDFNSDPLVTNEISSGSTKARGYRLRVRQA